MRTGERPAEFGLRVLAGVRKRDVPPFARVPDDYRDASEEAAVLATLDREVAEAVGLPALEPPLHNRRRIRAPHGLAAEVAHHLRIRQVLGGPRRVVEPR